MGKTFKDAAYSFPKKMIDKKLDARQVAAEIAASGKQLSATWKDVLCPVVLGPYQDNDSEQFLMQVKKELHDAGFTNTTLLKDFPDPCSDQQLQNNQKFKLLVGKLKEKGWEVCPIFCVHPALQKGHGKGLIAEMIETIYHFPDLRQSSVVLKDINTDFIEHLDFFHPNSIITYNNQDSAVKNLIAHLNGHEGYIKHNMTYETSKKINSPETSMLLKEVQR